MEKRKQLIENFRGSGNTAYAKLGSTCDFTLDVTFKWDLVTGSLGEILAKDMGLLSDDKLTDATCYLEWANGRKHTHTICVCKHAIPNRQYI